MAKIQGIEGLNDAEIFALVDQGARFVHYQYAMSFLIITLKRSSDIFFIRPDESRLTKGLPYTLISLIIGWWGIPWGPIYTIGTVFKNFGGGHDVTDAVLTPQQPAYNGPAPEPI